MKGWPIVLVAALAVGGGAWAVQAQDCPGHWHAAFAVFVDGHLLHFNHPIFYETPTGIHDYHMHADDQLMHFHPQYVRRCTDLEDFLGRVGVDVDRDGVTLNEYFGAHAGEYREGGNRTLEIHVASHGGAWREVDWRDVAGRQPRPGDRFLVTVGALTAALVEEQKAQVHEVPDNYLPRSMRAQDAQDADAAQATGAPGR